MTNAADITKILSDAASLAQDQVSSDALVEGRYRAHALASAASAWEREFQRVSDDALLSALVDLRDRANYYRRLVSQRGAKSGWGEVGRILDSQIDSLGKDNGR